MFRLARSHFDTLLKRILHRASKLRQRSTSMRRLVRRRWPHPLSSSAEDSHWNSAPTSSTADHCDLMTNQIMPTCARFSGICLFVRVSPQTSDQYVHISLGLESNTNRLAKPKLPHLGHWRTFSMMLNVVAYHFFEILFARQGRPIKHLSVFVEHWDSSLFVLKCYIQALLSAPLLDL